MEQALAYFGILFGGFLGVVILTIIAALVLIMVVGGVCMAFKAIFCAPCADPERTDQLIREAQAGPQPEPVVEHCHPAMRTY